jgi:hypothetical protein
MQSLQQHILHKFLHFYFLFMHLGQPVHLLLNLLLCVPGMSLIRFERLRGMHIIIISLWVQYQIGTLTSINIVSLSF